MRISDWSSDVCSSDLNAHAPCTPVLPITLSFSAPISRADAEKIRLKTVEGERSPSIGDDDSQSDEAGSLTSVTFDAPFPPDADRSEEHTSELQSLMRISYAFFCLKKKKTNQLNT